MSKKIRVEAKEVSDAIAKGLRQLGLRRDQVEVTVVTSPKKGFLGFGARDAVVELRPKRWSTADLDAQIYMDVPRKKHGKSGGRKNGRGGRGSSFGERTNRRSFRKDRAEESREKAPKANETQLLPCEAIQNAVIPENLKAPMQEAKDHLEKVLAHMGVKVENLHVWWDEKQQRILLTFDCDHPAIVIGKEGKTLEAIQYLSTLALSRHFDKPISVITDTQNYWRKAEDKINAEIEKGVDMIKRGNSVFRFRPMSAQLRRYIHRALEGNEFVATASEGEGKWRKVTLRPLPKVQEDLAAAAAASAAFVPGPIGEDVPEELPETAPCGEVTENQEVQPVIDNSTDSVTPVQNEETCACTEQQTETCSCCEEVPSVGEGNPSLETETVAQNQAEASQTVEAVAEQIVTETTVQQESLSDENAGATCTAEMARNCEEKASSDTGCACGPLFENVENNEESK